MKELFLFFMLVFLFGCDEVFDDTFYLQNSTEEEIKLIFSIHAYTGITLINDTIFILPDERKYIFNAHSAGGKTQYIIPMENVFSRFDVFQDVEKSKYDYFDDNWIYKSTSGNTAEYTMVVEPSHFD